jgi:hypothetical protein
MIECADLMMFWSACFYLQLILVRSTRFAYLKDDVDTVFNIDSICTRCVYSEPGRPSYLAVRSSARLRD